jgi:hypothetical protein
VLLLVLSFAFPVMAAPRGKADGTQARRTSRGASATRSSLPSAALYQTSPDDTREQVRLSAVTIFTRGGLTQKSLTQLITQGSNGELPAAGATREAFVAALINSLFGVKLTGDEAGKIARGVAIFANADELAPNDIAAARADFEAAFTSSNVNATLAAKVLAAFDRCLSEQQSEARRALKANLAAAQRASEVTEETVATIQADLVALVEGAGKPSDAALHKLAADLAHVVYHGSLTPREKAQLVHGLAEALGHAALDENETIALMNSVRDTVEASNVGKPVVQRVVADLEAIRAEIQPLAKQPAATTQPSAAVSLP